MSDTDLIKLYSTRILALAADIPNTQRLEAPMGSAKKRSPLCGSNVTVDVTLDAEGRIDGYGQDVKACALGQAAASVVGGAAPGRTRAEVQQARDELGAMLTGGPAPQAPFDGLEVLKPAADYRNRHASILLALDATLAAMDEAHAHV
ncbi:MAG: iron-sulfur cluster assembly scaffold protein [Shimia sp.]